MLDVLKNVINTSSNKHSYKIKQKPELYNWILEQTNYFPDGSTLLERVYCLLNNESPICAIGNKKKFTNNLNLGYSFCGRATRCKCARENHSVKISQAKQKTSKEEIEASNNKRKKTCLAIYGTEYNSQSQEIKNKKEQTCLLKFGVKTNLLHKDSIEKTKQTLIKNYGVDNPQKSKSIQNKTKETNLIRYGNICSAQSNEIKENIREKNNKLYNMDFFHKNRFTEKQIQLLTNKLLLENELTNNGMYGTAKKYNLNHQVIAYRINKWGIPYERIYSTEEFVKNILDGYNEVYVRNTRKIIDKYELDFYIPGKQIAIEVCGLYWHSENSGRDKHYHLNKHKACHEKNIQLITIFSDELTLQPNIVISKIKHILGYNTNLLKIYGRQGIIREIKNKEANMFLKKNHLQGAGKNQICLGFYYKDELLAVMTFSKNRRFTGNKLNNFFELVRYATSIDRHLVGVASKLFSYFIKNYSPEQVISYADRRWSNGNLYFKLGFELDTISGPGYWYTRDYLNREHRYKYTKHSLIQKGYNPKKTEWQIMQAQGYDRIWDCGNLKFVWNK